LWFIAAWRLLHPSCFTELQVAARESPKRFMKKVLSMPLEIRRRSTTEALSDPLIELDVPEFLLQCLREISTMESPEKLPGLIVGQYSLLLKDANPLDWNESSRDDFCSKILVVAIKLWKLPTAKGSALRLLDLWQVRSKHITTDEQHHELKTIGTEILQSVENSNCTLAVPFVCCFPEICNVSLVFDEFCQRGWTRPAIALAQRMGGFEKQLRQLKKDRLSQAIETAANLEGKEFEAIAQVWRKYQMRPVLVYKLLEKGKLELAQELIFTWGLKVQPKRHHFRAAAERSKKFFKFPKKVAVKMISSPGELDGIAFQLFFGSSCVGLDTESTHYGKPALLQVATETEAFLIDLLAIKKEDIQKFVARLMADPLIVKLGFGRSELVEMRRLGAQSVTKFIDMQEVGGQLRLESSGTSLETMPQQMSLSSLSEELLGKPLNKEIRASQFDQRPLHPPQQRYAALDAWILVKMWNLPRVQKMISQVANASGQKDEP